MHKPLYLAKKNDYNLPTFLNNIHHHQTRQWESSNASVVSSPNCGNWRKLSRNPTNTRKNTLNKLLMKISSLNRLKTFQVFNLLSSNDFVI